MRKIYYALIVFGILIMFYPKGNEWFQDYKQDALMKHMEESDSSCDSSSYSASASATDQAPLVQYEQLNDIFLEQANSVDEEEEPLQPTPEPTANSKEVVKVEQPKVTPIATITIKKINLSLPVLSGATTSNMRYAAAYMKQTSPLGEIGNAAIAAHRARTKGRLFNRLNEVAVGDEIVVVKNKHKYIYTVYEVLVVEPTDVSVLNRNKKDKVLTLITCDPVKNPTHRLIVHAKI
jgi:sortase A